MYRPELVYVLRGSSGATVPSRVGRGDGIAGRLIFFDQPGTGASDPVTPGAMPTLEQWADSITAVLDDLDSREAVLVAVDGAFATAALFAATYPSRTTALVVLEGYSEPIASRLRTDGFSPEDSIAAMVANVGHGGVPACA